MSANSSHLASSDQPNHESAAAASRSNRSPHVGHDQQTSSRDSGESGAPMRMLPASMQAPAAIASLPPPVAVAVASSSSSASPSKASSSYNTEWKDISIGKFCGLTVFFSTLENALFYPFYVLKTREQADSRVLGKSPWSASRAHLRTLLADQGVKGLYRGFVSSNLTAFPAYGVYMGVYSWAKAELGYESGADESTGHVVLNYSSLYAPFLAGLIADAASVALYVPGDVVVQRLQLRDSPYSSFSDACIQIYRTDGMAGFFRGFGATFVTSGIASAIWWVLYENVKNEMYVRIERKEKMKKELAGDDESTGVASVLPPIASSESSSELEDTPSLWHQLTAVNRGPQILAGFIAGTVTSILINPLDVIKTRLQVQDTYGQRAHDAEKKAPSCQIPNRKPGKEVRYRNMFHGLYRIYLDEGFRGYWRGVMPKLVSRGPLSAMSSLLYEVVMYLSKTDQAKRDEQKHKFQ